MWVPPVEFSRLTPPTPPRLPLICGRFQVSQWAVSAGFNRWTAWTVCCMFLIHHSIYINVFIFLLVFSFLFWELLIYDCKQFDVCMIFSAFIFASLVCKSSVSTLWTVNFFFVLSVWAVNYVNWAVWSLNTQEGCGHAHCVGSRWVSQLALRHCFGGNSTRLIQAQ